MYSHRVIRGAVILDRIHHVSRFSSVSLEGGSWWCFSKIFWDATSLYIWVCMICMSMIDNLPCDFWIFRRALHDHMFDFHCRLFTLWSLPYCFNLCMLRLGWVMWWACPWVRCSFSMLLGFNRYGLGPTLTLDIRSLSFSRASPCCVFGCLSFLCIIL